MQDVLKRLIQATIADADVVEGSFRPFATYDDRMDSITVHTRDCSYTEFPQSDNADIQGVSIGKVTDPERGDWMEAVYLIVHGAKSFCKHHNLVVGGKVELAKLTWFLARQLHAHEEMKALFIAFPPDAVVENFPNE